MRPLTMPRGTALVGAVLAATTMTGCATTGTAVTTAVPVSTSTSPRPVTRAIPAVAKATSAAPALKNTGTAWPTVIGSMLTYGQWLLANPNPALATTITEPGCASANDLTAQLQSLVGQDAYIQPSAPILTSIIGPSASPSAAAVVDVQAVRAAEPIRRRAATTATTGGAVITLQNKAQLPATALQLTLILGSDSRWRFCSVTNPGRDIGTEALTTLL
ncbi:hypothetical protein [Actinoplanes sp. NPDC020271]|uniref:hypothetical protein n=1 Tax=Actinoplanes sp. NPDC020271 TaxID=3363896 RepID=UPI0037B6E506